MNLQPRAKQRGEERGCLLPSGWESQTWQAAQLAGGRAARRCPGQERAAGDAHGACGGVFWAGSFFPAGRLRGDSQASRPGWGAQGCPRCGTKFREFGTQCWRGGGGEGRGGAIGEPLPPPGKVREKRKPKPGHSGGD